MVIATISFVTHILGLHNYLTARGIDYQALLIFCAIWGMAGSFISLLMSKWMAKMAMGVRIIEPTQASGNEKYLINVVHDLARKINLKSMPEVGIYDSPELNAFATGPSKNNALVAVSSGLLSTMNRDEIEGVLGHEITHIANGDMVTMTLIQGIVNSFALFFSRIAAYAVSIAFARNDERSEEPSSMLFYVLTFVFDILFTLLGSLVVATFSRAREYRADAGGAAVAGRVKMIAALKKLQLHHEVEDNRAPSMAALKISHQSGFLSLLASHPPLEIRIKRLEQQVVERR